VNGGIRAARSAGEGIGYAHGRDRGGGADGSGKVDDAPDTARNDAVEGANDDVGIAHGADGDIGAAHGNDCSVETGPNSPLTQPLQARELRNMGKFVF